jgi:Histidine kinase-, DNA gyrase B-, and HSP90-like ATPase
VVLKKPAHNNIVKNEQEKLFDEAGMRESQYKFNTHSIIRELAMGLYKSAIDCFREAVSNSIDSGATRIDLTLESNKITLEDNGKGIASKEEFLTVGTDSRKGDTSAIGEKGFGRISLLRMGGNVMFLSNNEDIGIKILLKIDEEPKEDTKRYDAFLKNHGTRLIIGNPDKKEMPNQKQLVEYLAKTFAPRILGGIIGDKSCEPIGIFVNQIKVQLPDKFIAKNTHILTMPGGKQVRGCLIAADKSSGEISLYVKGVMVKERHFISMNKFSGWVNFDSLKPRTDRNEVVETEIYSDFQYHMADYTKSRFAAIENELNETSASIAQLKNKIKDVMKRFMKDANKILPPNRNAGKDAKGKSDSKDGKKKEDVISGGVTLDSGGESGPQIPGWKIGEGGGHGPGGSTDPILSTVMSKGDKDIFIAKGNITKREKSTERDMESNVDLTLSKELPPDYWPVSYNPDPDRPMLVINLNNENIKMVMKETNHLGSKYFRIIPFLARVFIDIKYPEASNWPPDEYVSNLYKTTAYLYQSGGWA